MGILTGIASILVGGGLFAFIQFLINRHDSRNDKNKEILKAISDLDAKVEERFKALDEKIDLVDAKGDERNAVSSRVRILRFADEMQEDRKHSKDSWDQCLSDVTEYERYCEDHPKFKNGQTAATVSYIKRVYEERLEKHDFA